MALVLIATAAAGQSLTPGPPGPWVIDARGATSGVPTSIALYPTLGPTFVVPSRGFGYDVGAHVYPFGLGPARVGFGANLMEIRGTSADAVITASLLAPQVSFNFGTSNGWSYLSAGIGPARIQADRSATVQSLNAGGGARWFMNNHIAIAFDIRMHRLSPDSDLPRTTLVSASVGVSLK
jgi:hypothetical protein